MELTDNEKTTLAIFTSDAGAFETVQKIAKEYVKQEQETFIANTLRNFTVATNEEVGAKLRGYAEGLRMVDAVFRQLGQYKKQKDDVRDKNPGR